MNKHAGRLRVRRLTQAGAVAAIYVALTVIFAPIGYGSIQLRLSESLTVLPFWAPHTAFGLFVGCLISNLFNPAGFNPLDVVFGSLATLLAGLLTSRLKRRWMAPLPPILINAPVIGAVLAYTYAPTAFWPTFTIYTLQVGAGQVLSCGVLGQLLLTLLEKTGLKHMLSTE